MHGVHVAGGVCFIVLPTFGPFRASQETLVKQALEDPKGPRCVCGLQCDRMCCVRSLYTSLYTTTVLACIFHSLYQFGRAPKVLKVPKDRKASKELL